MPDVQDDWRLAGQEACLLGGVLEWKRDVPPNVADATLDFRS